MSTEQPNTVAQAQSERQNDDVLWTTPEVAAYLKVGISTVRRYVEHEGLPTVRFVGSVRFEPEAVKEWAKGDHTPEADVA